MTFVTLFGFLPHTDHSRASSDNMLGDQLLLATINSTKWGGRPRSVQFILTHFSSLTINKVSVTISFSLIKSSLDVQETIPNKQLKFKCSFMIVFCVFLQ